MPDITWNSTGVWYIIVFVLVMILTWFYASFMSHIMMGMATGGMIVLVFGLVFWFGIRPLIEGGN